MIDYEKWSDFAEENEILWICGGIDAYGAVIGHKALHDDSSTHAHTAAEKAISSWRFDVSQQNFMQHFIPQRRRLDGDEWASVQNWLVTKGFAEDESFSRI